MYRTCVPRGVCCRASTEQWRQAPGALVTTATPPAPLQELKLVRKELMRIHPPPEGKKWCTGQRYAKHTEQFAMIMGVSSMTSLLKLATDANFEEAAAKLRRVRSHGVRAGEGIAFVGASSRVPPQRLQVQHHSQGPEVWRHSRHLRRLGNRPPLR